MNDTRDIIEVLHEKDLKQLLEELGKYNDFENDRLLCKFCKESVSMNNIYGIFIIENDIELVCDNDLCYNKYLIEEGED